MMACLSFDTLADGGGWQSRAPMQDAFVRDNESNSNFGASGYIVAGNNREGVMMFDVSGLANVTAAKIKFFIDQCGTTAGVKWPLFFRVMRHDRWNESTITWNTLPDEFRVATPVLATNDVTLAGYIEVPAGAQDTWQEVDVTEAVKAAAPCGRLALHVYTYWDGTSGDTVPLSFVSFDNPDETLRPYLEFQGEVEPSASSLTLMPTDDVFIEAGHPDINYGVSNAGNGNARYDIVLVGRNSSVAQNNREGFLKFDLSGIGAERVDSAVLLMRMYVNQSNHTTGNTVQFQLTDKTDWNESEVTWNNAASKTGVTPGSAWLSETPGNAVRVGSANTDVFHTVELAPLVNQVLASGKTTISLHITMQYDNPTYFLFYSKEYAFENRRPRLLVTPKADAPLVTRKPVQETVLSSYNEAGKDTAYYNNPAFLDRVQFGCNGTKVLYGLMLFDTDGLENADFVRIRLAASAAIPAGDGVLRVSAWATERWNETNLTWNTATPWFPQPASISPGSPPDGLVSDIYTTQSKTVGTYFEADITAAARAAAAAGKMLTIGLFSNYSNWVWFYNGASDYPAVLIFPNPDAVFGNRVTCSLDQGGRTPALRLDWTPSAAEGATYSVERQYGSTWRTVASGLFDPTCLDAYAAPNVEHTYRITAIAYGTSERVVKSVTLIPTVKVFACADTYVRNGGSANTSFGTAPSLVHKYEYGEHSGGIREAFYRFDLSEMPEKFESATLKLFLDAPTGGSTDGAHFDLFQYPDFDWTDAAAPAWNDVFGNGWGTPQAYSNHPDGKRPNETPLDNYYCSEYGNLSVDEPVCFDLADVIRRARLAGDTHITLHTATYSANNWNFGIISRERAHGVSCAAQIVFTLKNWVQDGMMIVIR